ncbi:hypothetical protein GCM10020001_010620 [Nonomuraea salmonea]
MPVGPSRPVRATLSPIGRSSGATTLSMTMANRAVSATVGSAPAGPSPRCMAVSTASRHQASASSMEAPSRDRRPSGEFSRPRSYRILASMGKAVSDSAPPTNRANCSGGTSGRDSRSYSTRPVPAPSSSDGRMPDAASTDALRASPGVPALWSSPAPTRNM